jgi:predicted MFS family arabinose efflux permease
MTRERSPVAKLSPSNRALVAAVTLAIPGPLIAAILPVFVGVAADTYELTNRQLGPLASADFAGLVVSAFSGFFWVRRVNWRLAAILGVSLVVVGNLVSGVLGSYILLLVARFVTGVGLGISASVTAACLSDQPSPERGFALAFALQMIFATLVLMIIPSVVEAFGFTGVVGVLGFSKLATLPAIAWLPVRGERRMVVKAEWTRRAMPPLLCLLAMVLYMASFFAVKAFFERIAHDGGLTTAFVGPALAFGVFSGFLGAFLATILGDRMGRAKPLIAATIAHLLALLVLLIAGKVTAVTFLVALVLLEVSLNFALPYQIGSVVANDPTGRFVVWHTVASGLGATLGPLLSAMALTEDAGYAATNYVSAVLILLALPIFLRFAGMRASPVPAIADVRP